MAGRATERLHQGEVGCNADELRPAIHVAAHEGRIFLFGAFEETGNRVVGSGRTSESGKDSGTATHRRDGCATHRERCFAYVVILWSLRSPD